MRITRAKAAEVAENLHIDEDVVLDLNTIDSPAADLHPRKPLGEIAPNSSNGNIRSDDDAGVEKKKSGSKNAKGAKTGSKKLEHEELEEDIGDNIVVAAPRTTTTNARTEEVRPDENDSPPSPASRAAAEDLISEQPQCKWPCTSKCDFSSKSHDANAGVMTVGMSHLPVHDMRPQSPQSPAVQSTTEQLRKVPVVLENGDPEVQLDEKQQIEATPQPALDVNLDEPVESPNHSDEQVTETSETPSAPANDMPNNLQTFSAPSQISTPKKNGSDMAHGPNGSKESEHAGYSSTYDELEAAAVEAQASPSGSNKGAQGVVQEPDADPIAALDALDDAVEKINAEVPEVQASPAKPKGKKEKAAPVVRTTKASQARMSIAHGPKDAPKPPSWGKPRASMSVSQSASRRVTSVSSEKSLGDSTEVPEKKEAVIPHSKPRPMSMNFPAPKAPPKSTKAPTTSKFQLPGEAVAAKLKAAKEARLAKEAEDAKKKAFKARPAPAATKAHAVRQTSTSKARESLMGGKPPTTSALAASHRRASSFAGSRPSSTGKAGTSKPASSSSAKPPASNRLSTAPAGAPKVSKRPSTAMASLTNKAAPRASIAHTGPTTFSGRPLSTAAQPKAGSGTTKGKEVFNRTAQSKAAADKEKKEKEEAAKKARAEAAERSRQMSREWAEKQRAKKAGGKPAASKAGAAAVAVKEVEVENKAPETKV